LKALNSYAYSGGLPGGLANGRLPLNDVAALTSKVAGPIGSPRWRVALIGLGQGTALRRTSGPSGLTSQPPQASGWPRPLSTRHCPGRSSSLSTLPSALANRPGGSTKNPVPIKLHF